MKEIRVALAGPPNVGKSTLFNMLVGANRFVGNWPGKTVDKYEGFFEHMEYSIRVVDLPGTYSLNAQTEEEAIARDYIITEKPDVVVVLVDAVSLETTLYLAVQVLELYDRVVIAVNKIDAALKRGIHISTEKLSRKLGVPVVGISALRREGLHDLVDTIIRVAEGLETVRRLKLDYKGLDYYAREIEHAIKGCPKISEYPLEWSSMRLLEGDAELERTLQHYCADALGLVEATRRRVEEGLGSPPSLLAASVRYSFIDGVVAESVTTTGVVKREVTERLDKILLHPVAGPLTNLGIILSVLIVTLTVNTGFPIKQLLELTGNSELAQVFEKYTISGLFSSLFDSLSNVLAEYLSGIRLPAFLVSLIVDGVIGGVGAVLTFLPLVFIVSAAFGFLEDTGVMARIATANHSIMRRVGLSGKSLMPLLLGFGCNVPAIMGTKILETDREKLIASLIAPLIPCQARLVVLLILISALPATPMAKVVALVSTYAYSLLLVAVVARVASTFLSHGEKPELVLELPPYHRPSLRVIWWFAWDSTLHFLKKAGGIILGLSVVVWLLLHLGPDGFTEDISSSIAKAIGEALTPLTAVMGIPHWQVALALLTGFVAKETVASTLTVITGTVDPVEAVQKLALTPAQIASLIIFITLYTPCLATVATFHTQFRRYKLTILLIAYEFAIATVSAVIVYQALNLMGF
ncbi:ferrous iron transport protein B [Infirmifilum lucidum]|uniref:Ferrous iron transport protein B n=1 Tax=Infirmifilum lucidum TaxID=2776706 RepID=A0A7L9FIA7_9CREN|nr:ferrous iron transport protein B [Infirmifilum lucidum]QOJ79437.1 ferrous iron transport protein B [Infirmifilum lucidum]